MDIGILNIIEPSRVSVQFCCDFPANILDKTSSEKSGMGGSENRNKEYGLPRRANTPPMTCHSLKIMSCEMVR